MTVYIEYAFLENFMVDGTLLYGTFTLLKRQISYKKIVFSAALGGAFALIYPLLILPKFLLYLLKFFVGVLLVTVAAKGKNGIGRYAMNAAVFLSVSFLFGGALTAIYDLFSVDLDSGSYQIRRLPLGGLLSGCILLALIASKVAKILYKRVKFARFLCDCELTFGEKRIKLRGFLDSGNVASFQGSPVCFISPERFLELFCVGQVLDEMAVTTVGGEKKIKVLKLDEMKIYLGDEPNIIKSVYVSPSASLKLREYEVLLNSQLIN